MLGFSKVLETAQLQREHAYAEGMSANRIREHLRAITREPHPAGTPANQRVAEYIASRFADAGLQTRLAEYDVLLSEPLETIVELVAPTHHLARLREDGVDTDPDSRHPDASTFWIAYAASGDVTAPITYANYGRPQDYDELAEQGISVVGQIILARSYHGYRGSKAFEAQRRGVAGLIFYSDPYEDGAPRGPVYPDGPWAPMDRAERGSGAFDFLYPGDPLTPGTPSLPGATRLDADDVQVLPRIPIAAIAPRDAQVLLGAMDGPEAPSSWVGALPVPYRLGAGRAQVHLKVDQRREVRRIRNVMAEIVGTDAPDEWVMLSNHHDAWVFGAIDPCSATACMLETATGLGSLVRQGVRPRRSILFGSWDGEEYSFAGSTEWVEDIGIGRSGSGVACLNVDMAVHGGPPTFFAGGSPSLRRFLFDVAAAVKEPESVESVAAAWMRTSSAERHEFSYKSRYHADRPPRLGPRSLRGDGPDFQFLGTGSDYTPFLHHAGVPSVDFMFDGNMSVFGSVYDSFTWVERFGDPGFGYSKAIAQIWGIAALRLANCDALPYCPADTARSVSEAAQQIREHYDDARLRGALAEVDRVASTWREAGDRWFAEIAHLRDDVSKARLVRANEAIASAERACMSEGGIPGRPWFRNLLFAPRYDYSSQTLPAIREAAEIEDWETAVAQSQRLEQHILRASDQTGAASLALGAQEG
jgi:N-acetylated-alpha-linked acidic dipeptidase